MLTFVFPGQGSQFKGMGIDLFDRFPEITAAADDVLGYSIKSLCLHDPNRLLSQTQYTQPALFTVNALSFLHKIEESAESPDYVAGHSLGEYSALFAAGAFDFETGLSIVKKRGELMSQAISGGMAAVLGLSEKKVEEILTDNAVMDIWIANYNSPSQIVISGSSTVLAALTETFEKAGAKFILLPVSGAFHSPYMQPSKEIFERFLKSFTFQEPTIPVISNLHARPYRPGDIKRNLSGQIVQSVKWTESIRYLMGRGEMKFEEIGPGGVLTKLIGFIRDKAEPLVISDAEEISPKQPQKNQGKKDQQPRKTSAPSTLEIRPEKPGEGIPRSSQEISATSLGSNEFKKDYNLKYAYVTGSMYKGISSKEMVVKMAKAGMLGFLGTGGLPLSEIENTIKEIREALPNGHAYGLNLFHNPKNPEMEEETVDLFLRHGISNIEASAYMSINLPLVRYRSHGLKRRADGTISVTNRIIAKVSRPEVAEAFLSPAPERLVQKLVQERKISLEQAALLKEIPMADDLTVEADSGGHTDSGVAYVLMPAMLALRDEMMKKYRYTKTIRIGAAGGIGAPEAAAAAFILGADFILTGSINQCTVEARTSDKVKDMLQQINVQDTEYAPAGDMFEFGAKVQVMKRGVFFPARANKLFALYSEHNSLDEIDQKTIQQLETRYFKRSFAEIYQDCKKFYPPEEIANAERNPKHKMALIFRWYFNYSSRLALNGAPGQEVDYQIHCGPALGAFNQWVKGTHLDDWRKRNVDAIALKLMNATAKLLTERYKWFQKEI